MLVISRVSRIFFVVTVIFALFFISISTASASDSNEQDLTVAGDALSEDEAKEICSICYEKLIFESESFMTRCAHWFHKSCMDKWFLRETSKPCPSCRRIVTLSKADEFDNYFKRIKRSSAELNEESGRHFKKINNNSPVIVDIIKLLKYSICSKDKFDYNWLIDELLEKQTEMNINNLFENGKSLFVYAVMNSNTYAVEFFLKRGEDLNQLSEEQQDDLVRKAIKCGHSDFVELMIENFRVLERIFDDIFFLAVINNRADIVMLMMERGADINKKDGGYNLSAVQLAAQGNRVETLKVLLESGKADLSATDDLGMNLFQFSLRECNEGIVGLLLDYESPENIGKFDSQGRSPLLLACIYKKAKVAQLLIAAGAEIDRRCPYGFSPIEYVIQIATDDDEDEPESEYNSITIMHILFFPLLLAMAMMTMITLCLQVLMENIYEIQDNNDEQNQNNKELFEILLNAIKNDRRILESALNYAPQGNKYIVRIQKAIDLFIIKEQKVNEIIRISENGFQKSETIKYQVEKCTKFRRINFDCYFVALKRLIDLVKGLFNEAAY